MSVATNTEAPIAVMVEIDRLIATMREAARALNDAEGLHLINDLEQAILSGDAEKRRALIRELVRHTAKQGEG